MKKLIISALFLFVFSSIVFAVPLYLTHIGVLRDSSGNLVTGTRSMSFTIYDAASGGNIIYGPQNEASVTVNGGAYSVQIGPVTSAMFDGGDRYLEKAVGGTIGTPRLKLNSDPYAITATMLDGRSSALTGSNIIPYTNGSGKLDSSVIPTSSSPTNALTLSGFPAGISGNSIVPTTDASTGFLDISTIPSIPSAKIQTGAITDLKVASNINITTTGTIQASTLKTKTLATSGTGTGYCVGTGTISSPNSSIQIFNDAVTSSSLISVTCTTAKVYTIEALAVTAKSLLPTPNFTVGFTRTTATYPNDVSFNYLIIN